MSLASYCCVFAEDRAHESSSDPGSLPDSPGVKHQFTGGNELTSLSALTFSNLLTDVFGIEVSVGVIISPANDLRDNREIR
jgi:hypothetical protein